MGTPRMVRGSAALAAMLALGMSGCSSDAGASEDGGTVTVMETSSPPESSSSSTSSEESEEPESSSTSSTSETSRETSDEGSSVSGLPGDPGDYADAFVRAWGIGDRPDATRYATPEAVRSEEPTSELQ